MQKKPDPFYLSKRWKSIRNMVMKRDGYQCQLAKRDGKAVDAQTVHHIFPREDFPEYQWETWNLVALSFAAHNMMHERDSHRLTDLGERLREETAIKMGIEGEKRTVLIIGRPGTGKTAWVKRNLHGGACFDLDHLAAAVRLKKPKEERHMASRMLVNSMLTGFAKAAHQYVDTVYIVRTAPGEDEIFDINPDRIVFFNGDGDIGELPEERRRTIAQRLKAAREYAERNGIELEEIDA